MDYGHKWKQSIGQFPDILLDETSNGDTLWRFTAKSESSYGCSKNGNEYPEVTIEGFCNDRGQIFVLSQTVSMPEEYKKPPETNGGSDENP